MQQAILLQAASSGAGYSQLILLALFGVIFFFFFIRPQQKKQKKQKEFINSLQKGSQVVTIGGIHGKIISVEETTVILEVDKALKLKVEKGSISHESGSTQKQTDKL